MGYVYAVMWLMAGVIMLVNFRRLSPVVMPVSIYFFFLSGWWLANEFLPVDLMHGAYAWILRCISAAVVLFCVVVWTRSRGKNSEDDENNENK